MGMGNLILGLLMLLGGSAFAAEELTPSEYIAQKVTAPIKDVFSDAAVSSPRKDSITVEYRTREYMVYGRTRTGAWSTDLVKQIGPDLHGFRMEITLGGGEYLGTLDRPSKPAFSTAQARRDPYYFVSTSITYFKKKNCFMTFNIYFGEFADMKKVEKIYDLLADAGKKVLEVEDKGSVLQPPDNPTFKITNRPSQTEKEAPPENSEKK